MPVNKPTAFEQMEFGGVDSRSNPLNMPQDRMLRALNWVPREAGQLELRWGYSTVTVSTVNNSAIHTLIPYTTWNPQTRYIIRFQGTTPYQVKISDGTVTSPTVRGAAFASGAKGSYYQVAGRLHYGNGADQKWFDGTTWRNNGLRALVNADVNNVAIAEGVRELKTSEASTITLTPAAGGTFPATTLTGILFYVALFDTATQELGPATISVGSGRVSLTANQKVTLSVLPVPAISTWVKLFARTVDGGSIANFCTDSSAAITSCTRAGNTLTVVSPGHGLSTGFIALLAGTTNFDGVYVVTVIDVNTFTIALNQASGNNVTGANTAGGTVKHVVSCANGTTSFDVLSPATDTSIVVNDTGRGIPASSIGGANPGYQFYGAIYNPNGGGHVGNRIAIGPRVAQTAYRTNYRFTSLPDFSGTDSEWSLLIGRTGDGAQIPYICDDSAGNFLFTASGQTAITVAAAGGTAQSTAGQGVELPIRNGIIPATCDKFAVVGDYVYAADSISATIRRSGSQVNQNSGSFAGRVEQGWSPDDIDTFPTNDVITCIAEVDLELFVASLTDCGIANDQAGVILWRGPWTKGCAGKRAFCKTDHGFFWVSGDKELCTFENGLPVAISEEYEATELSQIGDAFLSTVEMVYHRDAALGIDHIEIIAQKTDGTPHVIIHDFRLADGRSQFGQGYGFEYLGSLASSFTACRVIDGNSHRQVWAGASNGQIYQLHSGSNDGGAANQFTADGILLINSGPNRLDVPYIDWYGDGNVVLSIGSTLKTDLTPNDEFNFAPVTPTDDVPESVQGQENNFLYRAYLKDLGSDLLKTYVRFQLTSHSADGSLALNSPPHLPLENYGRVWEVIPSVGQDRER